MSDAATCRKCGRPVIWAAARGGRQPFDPNPVTVARPRYGYARLEQAPTAERAVEFVQGYTSHWETCPKRGEHQGRAGRLAGEERDD